MVSHRLDRLNSLLKEVISDVIRKEIKNPHLPSLITITDVDITKDLQHAKVKVSVIGNQEEKNRAISILQSAANYIRFMGSKQVTIRYFPELNFQIDESLEKQLHMEELIIKIQKEREARETTSDNE